MTKTLGFMVFSKESLKGLLINGFCVADLAHEDIHQIGEKYTVYKREEIEVEIVGIQKDPKESHNQRIIFKKIEPQISDQLDLVNKKEHALMIVIEMIIAREQNRTLPDERIFKLFELAKLIFRAKDEEEFQRALAELIKS